MLFDTAEVLIFLLHTEITSYPTLILLHYYHPKSSTHQSGSEGARNSSLNNSLTTYFLTLQAPQQTHSQK